MILGLLTTGSGIGAALAQQTPTVKKVPVHSTSSVDGKELFREYCAVCHGTTGKGNGPAAAALKVAPSDLTLVAKQNNGKFPVMKIQHSINGESNVPLAHGSKDMPVWGSLFRHMGANEDLGQVRVYNLTKYIESIQEK